MCKSRYAKTESVQEIQKKKELRKFFKDTSSENVLEHLDRGKSSSERAFGHLGSFEYSSETALGHLGNQNYHIEALISMRSSKV